MMILNTFNCIEMIDFYNTYIKKYLVIICMTVCSAGFCFASGTDPFWEVVTQITPKTDNPRNSEGDFITLNSGRILFIYSRYFGASSSDHAPAYLASRFSDDGGKTWSNDDVTVVENEGGMNIMSVSLLRLQNGNIALFYLRKNSETDCIPMMRVSTDEVETWSAPVAVITDQAGYFVVNNNRVIQLKNGRLLVPASLHQTPGSAFQNRGRIFVYYSDDSGATWHSSTEVSNPQLMVSQEPGVVELKDGSVMMLMRSDVGVQLTSGSTDSGLTWTPMVKSNIPSPRGPTSIARIPSTDELLMVWNNNGSTDRRTPLTMAVSKDEGKSWIHIADLESDPADWYCYTAVHFTEKDVLLAYGIDMQLSAVRIVKFPQDELVCHTTQNFEDYTLMKLWDAASHNAFTDLIQYEGNYYCTFREATAHNPTTQLPGDGEVRILVSSDGLKWKSHALLKKTGVDLRDSKLSITPDGRMMVLMGGSIYVNGALTSLRPRVAFMNSNGEFTDITDINIDDAIKSTVDWLWRVTWDKQTGTGYGVVYRKYVASVNPQCFLHLVETTDGVNYRNIVQLPEDPYNRPNEATVELLHDGRMRIIVRREAYNDSGLTGRLWYSTDNTFTDWQQTPFDLGIRLGGPNIMTLPNGVTLIGSRYHPTGANQPAYTGLFGIDNNKATLLIQLLSGGDTSYPGFLIQGDELWVSYHSTHEEKTSIYLAKIKLSKFAKSITDASVSVGNISAQVYAGSPVCPKPVLVEENTGNTLIEGVDYSLSYANNNAVGNAQITIHGTGLYKDVRTVNFEINPGWAQPHLVRIDVNSKAVPSLARPSAVLGCDVDVANISVVVPASNITVDFDVSGQIYSGTTVSVEMDRPQIRYVDVVARSGANSKTYLLKLEKRFQFDDLVTIEDQHTMTLLPSWGNMTFKAWQIYRGINYVYNPLFTEISSGFSEDVRNYTFTGSDPAPSADDRYFATVVTTDGDTIRSCEKQYLMNTIATYIEDIPNTDIRLYPNPVPPGASFFFESCPNESGKAEITVYDMKCRLIQRMIVHSPTMLLKAPDAEGMYVYILRTQDGWQKAMKIIVSLTTNH